jgi:hypothetical protein
MSDARPFRLQLDVVSPKRHPQQGAFPAGGVLISEPMQRFRCNEKGCCCSGWDIPFKLEDFLRLHEHLDEGDRAALTKQLKLVLEPPKDGAPIDVGERVLHSMKLIGVGDDKHCRFLTPRGGCGVQEKYGLQALPDLCVDFPSFAYVQTAEMVELFFDPVCPEVIEQLAESDEPLRLVHREQAFGDPLFDLRAQHASVPVRAFVEGEPAEPAQLLAVRAACVEAFAQPRPPWRSLFAVLHGIRALRPGELPGPDWLREPDDPMPFLAFLNQAIDAHSSELMVMLLQRYKRFVFALDLAPLLARRDELKAHLEEWRPAMEKWLAPHDEQIAPLASRWLAHRFAAPFTKERGELKQAADVIAHLYATSLRFASALSALLERPTDRAIYKVALGASEFFYRSLNLPRQSLPWFASAGARP